MRSQLHSLVRTNPWAGRTALKFIPDLPCRLSVKHIGKFEVRLRTHRGYWLRSPFFNDGFMLGALERMLRSDSVVYDIGANIGLYSRWIAQRYPSVRVYAFEPADDNCLLLAKNLKLGGCSERVTIVPMAVGNEDGLATFQLDDVTSFSGTLDTVTAGRPSRSRSQYGMRPLTQTVRVATLDTIAQQQEFASPDVVKMDIEGAEAMALRGGRALLNAKTPDIVIELHGAEVAAEVLKVLWSLDYHCFGYLDADGNHLYKEIEPSDLAKITSRRSLRFLAASVRTEKLRDAIDDTVWD